MTGGADKICPSIFVFLLLRAIRHDTTFVVDIFNSIQLRQQQKFCHAGGSPPLLPAVNGFLGCLNPMSL